MELVKKNVHMNKIKENQIMQITLDDDFNVQDVKPDIAKIIKSQAQINVKDYKLINRKLAIDGDMSFSILYISDENDRIIHCMKGKIVFDDSVNMEFADADDNLKVNAYIEDLSVTMVNSRKISIKAIVTFECTAENIYDVETVVDIKHDENENVQYINEDVNVTQIAVNKKDICRVKEDIVLTKAKQNIMEVLYTDFNLLGTDSRPTSKGIDLKGSIIVFVMYASENGDVEFVEKEVMFNKEIDVDGCTPEMIDDVRVWLSNADITVKADADGEERILEFDAAVSLDIKLYYEETISVVKDFYGVGMNVVPVTSQGYYDYILLKNNCKVRVTDRVRVEENKPALMQLCNSAVDIKIDDVAIVEDGIQVEGVAVVTLLYVTNDDSMPIESFEGMIPFTQVIEAKGINNNSIFNIRPVIEHCSVIMTDSRECEVRISMSLDTIVFGRNMRNIITDYNEQPIEEDMKNERASMVGYVVKEGDNLWELAKQFGTTMECIRKMNFMEKDEISAGDRLLIN